MSEERRFPVNEIFGPTLQGEGLFSGCVATFVRFAGCDSKCEWCDTKYAWDPENAQQMTLCEIVIEILRNSHSQAEKLVILTGGNPALYDLEDLVRELHHLQMKIHVETQGTLFPKWLHEVDFVTFSPKSLTLYDRDEGIMQNISNVLWDVPGQVKFVIDDEDEYRYARTIARIYPNIHVIFQPKTSKKQDAMEGLQRLAKQVCIDPKIPSNVKVVPQLHKLIWGDECGV